MCLLLLIFFGLRLIGILLNASIATPVSNNHLQEYPEPILKLIKGFGVDSD
jgi:hypothetical protein